MNAKEKKAFVARMKKGKKDAAKGGRVLHMGLTHAQLKAQLKKEKQKTKQELKKARKKGYMPKIKGFQVCSKCLKKKVGSRDAWFQDFTGQKRICNRCIDELRKKR